MSGLCSYLGQMGKLISLLSISCIDWCRHWTDGKICLPFVRDLKLTKNLSFPSVRKHFPQFYHLSVYHLTALQQNVVPDNHGHPVQGGRVEREVSDAQKGAIKYPPSSSYRFPLGIRFYHLISQTDSSRRRVQTKEGSWQIRCEQAVSAPMHFWGEVHDLPKHRCWWESSAKINVTGAFVDLCVAQKT